jgi:hypothetical protein
MVHNLDISLLAVFGLSVKINSGSLVPSKNSPTFEGPASPSIAVPEPSSWSKT